MNKSKQQGLMTEREWRSRARCYILMGEVSLVMLGQRYATMMDFTD